MACLVWKQYQPVSDSISKSSRYKSLSSWGSAHVLQLAGCLQVVVGLGLVAALGYAVKEYALPKVTQWYKDWRHDSDKESAERETQKTAQLVASAIQAQVCSSLNHFHARQQ